jgi:hypothetical protein
MPVPQTSVRSGEETAMTDSLGRFTLDIPYGLEPVQVVVLSAAHSTNQAAVVPSADAHLELVVLPTSTGVLVDPAAGGMVQVGDVSLSFPPNALASDPSGPVMVTTSVLAAPDLVAAAPGGLAHDGGGVLESWGMTEVRLTLQDGTPVGLQTPVELSFPTTAGDGVSALWTFDETAGTWHEEGTAAIEDGRATAAVGHFSWWNIDEPLEDKHCVSGRLVDSQQSPSAGVAVALRGTDYLGGGDGWTDQAGTFCVDVKRDSTNRLSAYAAADGGIQWTATATTAGEQATSCATGGCQDLGELTARPLKTTCYTGRFVGEDGTSEPNTPVRVASPAGGWAEFNEPEFCVELPAARTLLIPTTEGPEVTIPDDVELPLGATCATDQCVDLGELRIWDRTGDEFILIPVGPRGVAPLPAGAPTIDAARDCRAFVSRRNWGQGVMACKMAVNANPDNATLRVDYGVSLYEQGDAGASKVQLEAARNSGSTDPRIDKYLGHIAVDFGDVPGGI